MKWNMKDKKLHITLQLHICSCILLTTFPYVCFLFIIFFFSIFRSTAKRWKCVSILEHHIAMHNTKLLVKKFRYKYSFSTTDKNITGHQKIIRFSWRKERGLLKIEYVLLTLFCGTIIVIVSDRIQQNS